MKFLSVMKGVFQSLDNLLAFLLFGLGPKAVYIDSPFCTFLCHCKWWRTSRKSLSAIEFSSIIGDVTNIPDTSPPPSSYLPRTRLHIVVVIFTSAICNGVEWGESSRYNKVPKRNLFLGTNKNVGGNCFSDSFRALCCGKIYYYLDNLC